MPEVTRFRVQSVSRSIIRLDSADNQFQLALANFKLKLTEAKSLPAHSAADVLTDAIARVRVARRAAQLAEIRSVAESMSQPILVPARSGQ